MRTGDDQTYYATYCKLETDTTDMERRMGGNGTIIGSQLVPSFDEFVSEKGKELPRVTIDIYGDSTIGFLPQQIASRVSRLHERGWATHVILCVVGFDQNIKSFWSEVAVVCYDMENKEAFDTFTGKLKERIALGEHPDVNLSPKELELVLGTDGDWCEMKSMKLPDLEKGNVYYKTKRSKSEEMALKAASGSRGCLIAMIAACAVVIIVIIALIIMLIH